MAQQQVVNYICPNCLAELRFVGTYGQLVCDSCGNKFDVSLIHQIYAEQEQAVISKGNDPIWDSSGIINFSTQEAAHLRSYSCSSCSAEIFCDETTGATSCPYCGNPTIMMTQFVNQMRPDYILPFKLDKAAAVSALKAYYKDKHLLPKGFTDNNHIKEIKGIYVPFWLFDGEADAYMRFHGTKTHSYTSGDYNVTDTDHYRVTRHGSIVFQGIPVDASSKMPNTHMNAIEPFDYDDLKPFSYAYLPGFMADSYDMDTNESYNRANERILEGTEEVIRDTILDYSTLTREFYDINLKEGDAKYVLMPIWLLSTIWNSRSFLFAMNGQTGKLIGDLPIDRRRYWSYFFIIATSIAAVFAAVLLMGGRLL